MPQVVAVTVNWNRARHTVACVRSLQSQVDAVLPVIVVDNGSSDDSLAVFQRELPGVEVLALSHNHGFAGGFNAGIRHALAGPQSHVFIVNNDTRSDPALVASLLAHAGHGDILGPLIFFAAEPNRIWSAGSEVNRCLLEIKDQQSRQDVVPVDETGRDFLSGCAMLVSRQVFDRIGLFDERFFMYYEDFDFCLRARQAGFRLLLIPQARLWHDVSVSSGGVATPGERYHMALSSGRFFRKHMRGWQRLIIPPYRMGSAMLWSTRLARDGRRRALGAYWRGLARGWLCA